MKEYRTARALIARKTTANEWYELRATLDEGTYTPFDLHPSEKEGYIIKHSLADATEYWEWVSIKYFENKYGKR